MRIFSEEKSSNELNKSNIFKSKNYKIEIINSNRNQMTINEDKIIKNSTIKILRKMFKRNKLNNNNEINSEKLSKNNNIINNNIDYKFKAPENSNNNTNIYINKLNKNFILNCDDVKIQEPLDIDANRKTNIFHRNTKNYSISYPNKSQNINKNYDINNNNNNLINSYKDIINNKNQKIGDNIKYNNIGNNYCVKMASDKIPQNYINNKEFNNNEDFIKQLNKNKTNNNVENETNSNKIYETNSLINQNANDIEGKNHFKEIINNNHIIPDNNKIDDNNKNYNDNFTKYTRNNYNINPMKRTAKNSRIMKNINNNENVKYKKVTKFKNNLAKNKYITQLTNDPKDIVKSHLNENNGNISGNEYMHNNNKKILANNNEEDKNFSKLENSHIKIEKNIHKIYKNQFTNLLKTGYKAKSISNFNKNKKNNYNNTINEFKIPLDENKNDLTTSKKINNLTKNNFIAERTKNINKPKISFNNIKKYNTHKSFSFYNKASTSIISSPKKVIVMKIIKSDSLNQTTKDMDYSDYKKYKENVKDLNHERNLIKNNLLTAKNLKEIEDFLI